MIFNGYRNDFWHERKMYNFGPWLLLQIFPSELRICGPGAHIIQTPDLILDIFVTSGCRTL